MKKLVSMFIIASCVVVATATPANAEEMEVEITILVGEEPTCGVLDPNGGSLLGFLPRIKVDVPKDLPFETYEWRAWSTTYTGEFRVMHELVLVPRVSPNVAEEDFTTTFITLIENPGEKWQIAEAEIRNIKTGEVVFEWTYTFIMEDYSVCLNRRQAAKTTTTTTTIWAWLATSTTTTTTTTTVAPTTTTVPPATTTTTIAPPQASAEAPNSSEAISNGWWVALTALLASAGVVWFRRDRTN